MYTNALRYRRHAGDRFRQFATNLQLALGIDVRLRTDDRELLETIVLPYVAAHPPEPRVLFVGTAPYTKWYPRLFTRGELWTIEPDVSGARFGARHHVCAPLQVVAQHFLPSWFDWIICNGVFGWGLDEAADIDAALRGCAKVLKPGGSLIVGWNDVTERVPPGLFASPEWLAFKPTPFAPLGKTFHRCVGEHRHTFSFYAKA